MERHFDRPIAACGQLLAQTPESDRNKGLMTGVSSTWLHVIR